MILKLGTWNCFYSLIYTPSELALYLQFNSHAFSSAKQFLDP